MYEQEQDTEEIESVEPVQLEDQMTVGEEMGLVLKNISRMFIGRTIESSRCGRSRWNRIRVITGEAL
ncbi:hypothetical protein TNCV_1999851 [Trichonephila clavipes]|nr:hypothetical protein TNCV_1999851 [Trichonephila clavipes]